MLIGTVLLVAGLAAAQEDGFRAPRATCPHVALQATGKNAEPDDPLTGKKPAVRTFSARTAGDLEITVWPRRPTPPGRAVLKVYTPQGHLYQELPVTGLAGPRGRVRRRGQARLPVSGTLIVQSSLYGLWRIETQLDGSPKPCGSPFVFEVTP